MKQNLNPWKMISKTRIVDSKWLKVDEESCLNGNGVLVDHFYIESRPEFALIVAFDADRNLLVVRQYRHGVQHVMTELPAGMIEEGEDPSDAAKRELREETGYEADKWVHLFGSCGEWKRQQPSCALLFCVRPSSCRGAAAG